MQENLELSGWRAFRHPNLSSIAVMMNKIVAILLLFTFFLGAGASATAQTATDQERAKEVRKLLEERDREIKRLLGDKETFTDAQRDQLKNVINAGIDFQAMGRAALGPFWQKITADQRKQFVDVFSEIVRNQSLSNLDVYRSKVTYKDITVTGDSAHVVTTTVYKDVPTEVEYTLGHSNDAWRVHDIILDDVSTAEGYARSFQTVVRKRGFDALMQSLNKKLEKMSS